jgi:hypothetical protein
MATTSYERGEVMRPHIFANCWIAPDGTQYYVDGVCNHDATAYLLGNKLYGICEPWGSDLIARGWIEVSQGYYCDGYAVLGDAPTECIGDVITQGQRDTLFDMMQHASSSPAYAKYAPLLAKVIG